MPRRNIFEKLALNGLGALLPRQFAPLIWVLMTCVLFALLVGVISLINGSFVVGGCLLLAAIIYLGIIRILKRRSPHLFTDQITE